MFKNYWFLCRGCKLPIVMGLLLIGCGEETRFSSDQVPDGLRKQAESITEDSDLERQNSDDAVGQEGIDDIVGLDEDRDGNSQSIETLDEFRLLETFSFGEGSATDLVDYLIVLDNSCSMEDIRDQVSDGFLAIIDRNVLPARAKLAVMNTMHGLEPDYDQTGTGITGYAGIEKEPGFLDFVHQDAVEEYRALGTDYTDEWSVDACNERWFSPTATNANGVSCLEAATQSSFSCLGAEAGLQAVKQLLTINQGNKVFRDGAIVNIIFVSDTHDPGTNSATLLASRPDYDDLQGLLDAMQPTAGLKFHAIAPTSVCTVEQLYDLSYNTMATASGGLTEDSCTSSDYSDFMMDMVETSIVPKDPIFTTSKAFSEIESVKVNGTETSNYTILNKQSIRISELEGSTSSASIEITYKK
ncbi:MAG: hypothetical protein HRU19_05585 [Pseudobacteriovorax sp.]|nr:hypothetical protein [Pseudobacteriovorax sp.]